MSAGMCQRGVFGALAVVLSSWCGVQAVERNVPAEYITIQSAIDAAGTGDEVVVAPGRYSENILVSKAVTVRGTDPGDPAVVARTVIDGHLAGPVVTLAGRADKTVSGLTIRGGLAASGGGVLVQDGVSRVLQCVIRDNQASSDGGGVFTVASVYLVGCAIEGNRAGDSGGGVCDYSYGCDVRVSGCGIRSNDARQGGGLWGAADSRATITSSVIAGNTAAERGGGVGLWTSLQASVSNCLLAGNAALQGGAAWWQDSPLTIRNCTISGNLAQVGGGLYGYTWSYADKLVAGNSIVWGNQAAGPQIVLDGLLPDVPQDLLTISYCDIQGGLSGVGVTGGNWQVSWGAGNLDRDPQFVDAGGAGGNGATWSDNDYQLAYGSACIDAGSDDVAALLVDATASHGMRDTLVVGDAARYAVGEYVEYDDDLVLRRLKDVDVATGLLRVEPSLRSGSQPGKTVRNYGAGDLAGRKRILLSSVDIGAYELQPVLRGDLNGDGQVNLSDLMIMAPTWASEAGEPDYHPVADLRSDGSIDILDLLTLVLDWGKVVP